MSSLAQEEARSISENCVWGQRKRFADGKVTVPFSRFLGYDRGEDGSLVINPEQAVIVRKIYGLFLQGLSPFAIAGRLTEDGVTSPGGKDHWNASCVRSILSNEKYKGDALLQKSYTVDFLTKEKKPNEGEIPQYYVSKNHEAIIPPATFDMVQRQLVVRRGGKNRRSGVSIFSSRIKCGDCGSWYGSKVWHSNDKYRHVVWQCNHKFEGDKCTTPTLEEDDVKRMFVSAANSVITEKSEIISAFEVIKESLFSTAALEAERTELETDINVTAELMQSAITENARVALDQDEYTERYNGLVERFDKAKERYAVVCELITERTAKREQIELYLSELSRLDLIIAFHDDVWLSMIDYITVNDAEDITFRFKDGTEVHTH